MSNGEPTLAVPAKPGRTTFTSLKARLPLAASIENTVEQSPPTHPSETFKSVNAQENTANAENSNQVENPLTTSRFCEQPEDSSLKPLSSIPTISQLRD